MDIVRLMLIFAVLAAFAFYNIYRTGKREAFLRELSGLLEREGYDAYTRALDGPEAARFIRQRNADRMRLNAAISKENHPEARRLIEKLNMTPMSSREYVNYNMTVLGYAVSRGDRRLGETARDALHKPSIRKGIVAEADQVYDIYLLHGTGHIEELESFARKCKIPSGKATAYYRIAKQYYYLNDMEKVRRYIDMAAEAFPDPGWRQAMKEVKDSGYEKLA